MDTLDFLQRVLPSDGLYASIVINDGDRPRQNFLNDTNSLAKAVNLLSKHGNNVYFAVASFNDRAGGRRQTNVHKIKSLFLDVDCGENKPYASWKDGLQALGKFIKDTGMPRPLVIHSGNGLHVYWVLDEEVSVDEWAPVAAALKSATQTLGFEVDPAVPTDSARVLRAVGTINPKGGKEVKMLLDAPTVQLDNVKDILAKYYRQSATVTKLQPRKITLLDSLAVKQEYPPTDGNVILSKCAQLRWGMDNQADVSEPFWYAMLGIAAFCINPEQTAIEWSQNHPTFDANETVRKLEQWKNVATGPATCARFASERPDGCKGCKFKDRITTPARLSVNYEAVEVADDAPDEVVKTVPVPWPYKRTATGIKKSIDDVDVDVCKFDVYPVGYGRDETLGYETVRYRWNRPHAGWQTLSFRQAYLADGSREFATTIADQGIVLLHKKQTEDFQHMLRSYMEELRQLQSMSNLYATMGWKENNTQFLLGDTIYKASGGVVTKETASFASQTQRLIEPMFTSAGTVEEAAKFTSLLEKANMPIHMFSLCVAMSAPLYQFTGLKGLTINLYGPTGAGKTLAQLWQQSIWGDPTRLHYTAKFTPNALYARMGLYNNLPVTIDETTMLQSKDVGDFLYSVSQGREKARLTRTAEERDTKTWSTVVTTSSNRSMSSMLVASGLETDAQMARLLEVTINAHPLFTRSTTAGRQIYDYITTHYGTIGPKLIEYWSAMGEERVREEIEHHRQQFFAEYNCTFTGSERYWEQAIILADYAGKVGRELGLIQFNYKRGTEEILTQIGAMRKSAKEFTSDSFDVLAEYINAHSGQTVTVMHTGGGKPQPDYNRIPRGEVHVRFDVYRPTVTDSFDRGTVLIDRAHFRKWLATKGGDYRSLIREITEQGVNATPKTDKAYLGKDTSIKLGQQYVFGVSLLHPRLIGVLTDMDDNALSSGLTVIQGGRE